MGTVDEFVSDFNKNPEENAKKMSLEMQKKRQEIEEYFNNFLIKIKNILDKEDCDYVELDIEENWLFVSENITKILMEVKKKWWHILNIQDFEQINKTPNNQKGFLYTELKDLKLKLCKI